jgi:hypothetical protein
MKTFKVRLEVSGTYRTEVEAEDQKMAEGIAMEEAHESMNASWEVTDCEELTEKNRGTKKWQGI